MLELERCFVVVLGLRISYLSVSRNHHPAFPFQIGIEGKAQDQVSLTPSDRPASEHHDHGDFIDLAYGPH